MLARKFAKDIYRGMVIYTAVIDTLNILPGACTITMIHQGNGV